MRQGNKKIFLNQATLTQMLNLRLNGFSYNILASIFSCDRTSLAYMCDKYYIKPIELVDLKSIVNSLTPKPEPPKWKIVNGERYHL